MDKVKEAVKKFIGWLEVKSTKDEVNVTINLSLISVAAIVIILILI